MKKENRRASKQRHQPEEKPQSFSLYADGDSVLLVSSEAVTQVRFTRDQALAFAFALQKLVAQMPPPKSKLILPGAPKLN